MASSSPRHLAPRRGMPKGLKIAVIAVLVLANLAALAVIWALNTGEDVLALASTDQEVVSELSRPSGQDLTFLVVGSDSREGIDDLSHFGSAPGERGDVIMLVRLDRSTGVAKLLSIPRDLWVDIPGYGEDKINAAYSHGGPRLMVQTINQNLGIEVNHYVEIDFRGFISMVNELGGIRLDFPYPARDVKSGLNVDAGTQILDGEQALAYARSRKYQELRNNSWVGVDDTDIGRTHRQQEVVRAILSQLKSPSSVADAGRIAGSLARHMTVDATLAEASIAGLAWDFKGLIGGDIEGQTLPVYGDTVGGLSIVRAVEPDARQVIEAFTGGAVVVADDPIRVQVLNGNGVVGAAGRMSDRLAEAGFEIAGVGNADTRDYETTTVLVPSGSGAGERIVSQLGFGVVEFGSVDNGYDAVVIVGADAS